MKISIHNLSKTFVSSSNEHICALNNISLDAGEGELVAVVGPSGCGKSTLLDCIAGIMIPDSGSIEIDGYASIGKTGVAAYMTQSEVMLPWRHVVENVALPLEIQGAQKSDARRQALTLLKTFGLETFADMYPGELSGGMRQRASLARAFLTGKDILILDEPFGKLDALTRVELQEWFLRIWGHHRKTIIFVTHDIDEAIYLSNRVVVLSERPGEIVGEVYIPLERPRRVSISEQPEFTDLKRKVREFLEGKASQTGD